MRNGKAGSKIGRRGVLGLALAVGLRGMPRVSVTALDLLPVRATERTVGLFVRLRTDRGLTGCGEASDAFGYANTTAANARSMEAELRGFFPLLEGKSVFGIEAFRQAAWTRAETGGLIAATAFSALEQCLWDLAGQALAAPSAALFGGAVREQLRVYANINRATRRRTPEGFADTARRAAADGFRAVKAAPFDGFPPPGATVGEIAAAVDRGIACVAAMREAVSDRVEVMVDCHSFFDVALARRVAERLEPYRLAWYEEPVAPERIADTLAIRQSIQQPMAGGEVLFGVKGFAPLCRERAVDVIMPDVKHCGGLLELTRIAALAQHQGIGVAPHNPSGPVSTAASAQVCAGLSNFRWLELQWGEVGWRAELVSPAERFEQGSLRVSGRPGLGVTLNERLARRYPV